MNPGPLILPFLFLFIPAGFVLAQEAPFPDFLVGTWQIEGKNTFEQWRRVTTGHLTGSVYQSKAGKRKESESLELMSRSGVLLYRATVHDQNEGRTIEFPLATCHDGAYAFVNTAHDFPKRISYQLVAHDTILVDVSGSHRGFTYHLIRRE